MNLTADAVPRAEPENPAATARVMFQFHGTGSEYFRIWIVNMSLTILTLGIYSAWAKVRKNRYIYGSLELEGSHFDYLALPLQILRGRLIAIALLLAYIVTGAVMPLLSGVLALLLSLLSPWLLVRSRMFNMRYTTYRNIRFGFQPAYAEAAVVIIFWGAVSILTLGLGVPYAHYRRNQLIVNNTRFGNLGFDLTVPAFRFFWAYGLGAVLAILLLALVGGLANRFDALLAGEPGGLGLTLSLALPWLVGGLCLFVVWQFVRAYILRATLNGTVLRTGEDGSAHVLGCDWSLSGMLFIYCTNIVAIVLSLGLLIPWAQMRITRYQLNHTWLDLAAPIDSVVAEQGRDVSSIGEEIGDVFDVDIGL